MSFASGLIVFVHVNFNISRSHSVRCSVQTFYREFFRRSWKKYSYFNLQIETEGNSAREKTLNLVLNLTLYSKCWHCVMSHFFKPNFTVFVSITKNRNNSFFCLVAYYTFA